VRDRVDTPMAELRCDFYDWATHRHCERPAHWVTHQHSRQGPRLASYYCDKHHPPRARPLANATRSDHSA